MTTGPEQRPYRLVSVGDSFTEGMCDDLRDDGEYVGWADRVAEALSMAPDLLTFHAGPNDVLRKGTDLPDLFRRNEAAVSSAVQEAAGVVIFTAIPRAGGADRLHLNAEGHRRATAAVLEAVGVEDLLPGAPGWWRDDLPAALAPSRRASAMADVRWVTTHLVPWVGRRLRGVSSGDGRKARDRTLRVLASDASV